MDVSISTLATVILVAIAASIASYWISQWSPLRDRGRMSWWIGISLGVGLLITAAAIAILSIRLPTKLQIPVTTEWIEASGSVALEHTDTTSLTNDPEDSPSGPTLTAGSEDIPMDSTNPPVTALEDPWRATECVWAWRPDPTNETRWLIENECGTPVAVVTAGCLESMAFCDDYSQPVWKYRSVDMLLPAKPQRPVSDDEQSVAGNVIRFYACAVTDPEAIRLLGLEPHTRASQHRTEFNAVSQTDTCLFEVASWNATGRSSSMLIPVLLGDRSKGGSSPEQLWVGL